MITPTEHEKSEWARMAQLAETSDFLDHIYLLVRQDQPRSASVAVIDYIDRLLNGNLFRACNQLLDQADLGRMPSALRRSFLMVTRPAKDKLPARTEFYRKALDLLARERNAETAHRMLKSLA